jgi:hypothetical protein
MRIRDRIGHRSGDATRRRIGHRVGDDAPRLFRRLFGIPFGAPPGDPAGHRAARPSPVRAVLFALAAACPAAPLIAGEDAARDTAVTVYSGSRAGALPADAYRPGAPVSALPGYAVVRDVRELALTPGRNDVRLADVAGEIDPTTVRFASLTDPDHTRVVEQNFEFDLVNTDKLLARYIDRDIVAGQSRGDRLESYAGTLASTSGGLVLTRPDGSVQILGRYDDIRLPSLPGGLITRPTLVWKLDAERGGTHKAEVAYQTGGFAWWADYNLALTAAAGQCRTDLAAWVTVVNRSGASYRDAKLKLVAGDVHRAPAALAPRSGPVGVMSARAAVAPMDEQSLFEYHLYTLGFRTTLPDNATKQLELFAPVAAVPCNRTLVYQATGAAVGPMGQAIVDRGYGAFGKGKVDAFLEFRNDRASGLDLPLPAGRVRVSQRDPKDGTLEFIGEDAIDHTARGERVLLKLGSSFDVVAERRQVDFSIDTARKVMEETIEVSLRNRKDSAETVRVREALLRWTNWEITARTLPFERIDARNVEFVVPLAAQQGATVRYTVRYTW